eukprot:6196033-Pleurochrysis_carterae.AAC.2
MASLQHACAGIARCACTVRSCTHCHCCRAQPVHARLVRPGTPDAYEGLMLEHLRVPGPEHEATPRERQQMRDLEIAAGDGDVKDEQAGPKRREQ